MAGVFRVLSPDFTIQDIAQLLKELDTGDAKKNPRVSHHRSEPLNDSIPRKIPVYFFVVFQGFQLVRNGFCPSRVAFFGPNKGSLANSTRAKGTQQAAEQAPETLQASVPNKAVSVFGWSEELSLKNL